MLGLFDGFRMASAVAELLRETLHERSISLTTRLGRKMGDGAMEEVNTESAKKGDDA